VTRPEAADFAERCGNPRLKAFGPRDAERKPHLGE
jgi:hypothetical protein